MPKRLPTGCRPRPSRWPICLGIRVTLQSGDTFGGCYLVGWFDDVAAMERAYDRFKGASGLAVDGPDDRPTGYRTLTARELTPVRG